MDSIMFCAQTPGLRKKHIKNEKLTMKMKFFSKKTAIFSFFVYKRKTPQKWQIPLRKHCAEHIACKKKNTRKEWCLLLKALNEIV